MINHLDRYNYLNNSQHCQKHTKSSYTFLISNQLLCFSLINLNLNYFNFLVSSYSLHSHKSFH